MTSNEKIADAVVAKALLDSDAVLNRAGVTAEALAAANVISAGIEDELELTTKRLDDHMNHDNERFQLTMTQMATKTDLANAVSLLATKEDLAILDKRVQALSNNFATKEDIKEWVKMNNNIETAQAIGRGASKFVLWLAGFIVAAGIIWAGVTGVWTKFIVLISASIAK